MSHGLDTNVECICCCTVPGSPLTFEANSQFSAIWQAYGAFMVLVDKSTGGGGGGFAWASFAVNTLWVNLTQTMHHLLLGRIKDG
jgi:hypothetical protein